MPIASLHQVDEFPDDSRLFSPQMGKVPGIRLNVGGDDNLVDNKDMLYVTMSNQASSDSNMSENVLPKNINFEFIKNCYNNDQDKNEQQRSIALKLEPLKSVPT